MFERWEAIWRRCVSSSFGQFEMPWPRPNVTHELTEPINRGAGSVPPHTGQPFMAPPWANLGSSMLCKNGGTLEG
jgi:hypothetical protein